MKIIRTVTEMRAACRSHRQGNKTIGFIPTMGALHEGHLSLVRAARQHCDVVAASIFVNPAQFGPNEDFSKYPRTFDRDCELLKQQSVDLLFAPEREEMYPPGATTFVGVEGLSERLCGRSRPGHFRGVTTIVNKLFNIVEPNLAYFGQKDAAQCAIIKKMVSDLDLDVEIILCPIVREPDGLAMSSRNVYLSAQEREQALVLWRALQKARAFHAAGHQEAAVLIESARQVFAEEPRVQVEYIEIVDPLTLKALHRLDSAHAALFAVAAKVGGTRLIDNVMLPAGIY